MKQIVAAFMAIALQIGANPAAAAPARSAPKPLYYKAAADALSFRPDLWRVPTDPAARRWYNWGVCYGYARGDLGQQIVAYTHHSNPGGIAGHPYRDENEPNGKSLISQMVGDGMIFTGQKIRVRKGTYPTALYLEENKKGDAIGYHIIRINGGPGAIRGLWSQRFVTQVPTLVTFANGAPVQDPAAVSLTMSGIAFPRTATVCYDCYKFYGYLLVKRAGIVVPAKFVQQFKQEVEARMPKNPVLVAQFRRDYSYALHPARRVVLAPIG